MNFALLVGLRLHAVHVFFAWGDGAVRTRQEKIPGALVVPGIRLRKIN